MLYTKMKLMAPLTLGLLSTGVLDAAPFEHGGSARAVAFAPDGKTVASGGDDTNIRLRAVATGKEIRALQGHEDAITMVWSVAVAPDGKSLASGGANNAGQLWDAGTGKEILTFQFRHHLYQVAFAPDGKTVAGALGAFVQLLDVVTGREVLLMDECGACSLAFAP